MHDQWTAWISIQFNFDGNKRRTGRINNLKHWLINDCETLRSFQTPLHGQRRTAAGFVPHPTVKCRITIFSQNPLYHQFFHSVFDLGWLSITSCSTLQKLPLPISLGRIMREFLIHKWKTFKTAANLPKSGCSTSSLQGQTVLRETTTKSTTSCQTLQSFNKYWQINKVALEKA